MTARRTRERDRGRRRREAEQEVSIWKEYKVIIQLLVCIVLIVTFVFTQGIEVYENRTVRDIVKEQLSETTNVNEVVQSMKQFVDAKRLWPGEEEPTAPVSASVQSQEATKEPEGSGATGNSTAAPSPTVSQAPTPQKPVQ